MRTRARLRRAATAASEWTPAALGSALQYWWDFADAATLYQDSARTTPATGTDPLGGVADKAGNSRHLAQSTAGTRPALAQAAIGTRQAAAFSGGTRWLATGAFGSDLAQPRTVFCVVKNTDKATTRAVYDGESSGGRNGLFIFGSQWTGYAGGFGGELPHCDPSTYVICYEFNGASSKMWRNGVRTRGAAATPVINSGTQGCGGVTVGSDSAKTNFPFSGHVGEIFAVDGTVSDANRQAAESYLSAKWSRPVYQRDVYGGSAGTTGWVLLVPPTYTDGAKPLVYYHHGRNGAATSLYTDNLTWATVQALQTAGYWVAASDGGGPTHWGNPGSVTENKSFRTFLEARDTFSRCMLWPISMGAASAFNCLRDSQFSDIKGVYLTYPVCSLAAIDAANYSGTFRAELLAAHAGTGGVYSASDPLALSAAGYPDIKYKFVASASDTVVPKADHTDPMRVLFAGRSPALTTATTLRTHTGDHGDSTAFDTADMVAFFDACT